VAATTVSRELKEDLLALLTRLGIAARVSTNDPVPLVEKFPDFYDIDDEALSAKSYVIHVTSSDAVRLAETIDLHLSRKRERLAAHVAQIEPSSRRVFDGGSGDYFVDEVEDVSIVEADVDQTYCLTVTDTHSLIANDTSQKQCDGDEDCVMLLLDGLLNFSKSFLPDKRGGQMDAPLVMSSRIDPSEIDDEAHNMDIATEYPMEFFEATRELADPEEVEDLVQIAESTLGTDHEYTGFGHTHDTSTIHLGPELSAYKTLGSMMDKMDAQQNSRGSSAPSTRRTSPSASSSTTSSRTSSATSVRSAGRRRAAWTAVRSTAACHSPGTAGSAAGASTSPSTRAP